MARKNRRNRRKVAPRRRSGVKKRGASFIGKEKNSFMRGFWKGFFIARKNKSGSTKTKNSRKKRVGKKAEELRYGGYASPQIRVKSEIKRMADAYARHMGKKFNLSEAEIQKNAKEHFEEAMDDPKMLAFLYQEYGAYL